MSSISIPISDSLHPPPSVDASHVGHPQTPPKCEADNTVFTIFLCKTEPTNAANPFGPRNKKKNEILIRAFPCNHQEPLQATLILPSLRLDSSLDSCRIFSLTHHNMGRVDPKPKETFGPRRTGESGNSFYGNSYLPVEPMVYKSEADEILYWCNITLPYSRFDIFTGYQTIHQREQSYKVGDFDSLIFFIFLIQSACLI
ncbi:Uncharacterized protein TCM_006318 [Theobroma cacao]|uniref:Uncharacterized protein n=1 Tax=Theobroma cacao TaxID=3641 RepID=A0A061DXX1_THECC|nr:Uncharacterized protein TCM_006318 [Theobroma cacao]